MRLLALTFFLAFSAALHAAESWTLLPHAQVTSEGVFLQDLLQPREGQALPRLKLTNSPAFGTFLTLSRADIQRIALSLETNLAPFAIYGPDKIRVVRSSKLLAEGEIRALLTDAIQSHSVKDRGELEIRFTRSWNPIRVPDEPLQIKIMELPTSGVSAHFICKFELLSGNEGCGIYSLPLQASLWNEIYVAASPLVRGQLVRDADLALERRDVFTTRDALTELPLDNPYLELAQNIRPGLPITSRSLKLRTVVKRGRLLDALLLADGIKVSAKVEALEDGLPGQIVRVRNVRSKRELKGKVQDEQTIQIYF